MFLNKSLVVVSTLIFSMVASAGQLGFMTKGGHAPAGNNLSEIVSAQTGISMNPDYSLKEMYLMVKDSRGRECRIAQSVLPKTDLVQLAVQAIKEEKMMISCKTDKTALPGANESQLATLVWVSYSK